MSSLRLAASAAVFLLLSGCDPETLLKGSLTSRAEKRVQQIFETVSREGESTSMEYQAAVCLWWKEKHVIHDLGEFNWAYDKFNEFKRQGSLAKGFRFEIEGSEEVPDSMDKEVLVRAIVNGRKVELVVPAGKAIRWKVAPPPPY